MSEPKIPLVNCGTQRKGGEKIMCECANIITGKTTGELLKEIISMIDSNIDLAEDCEKSNAANDNFEEALRSQTEKICMKMLKEELERKYFLGEN